MTYPLAQWGWCNVLRSVKAQINRVREDFPDIEVRPQQDGTVHLVIPRVPLWGGWNKEQTRLLITLPVQYPHECPNGFGTDFDLRRADGQMPQGGSVTTVGGEQWLWFCWRPNQWNLERDTLWKYVRFCLHRFEEVHG